MGRSTPTRSTGRSKRCTATSARGHKYHAVPTIVDGIRFASKAEARRYADLKMMEKAGLIVDLELQPAFDLHAPQAWMDGCNMKKIGKYIADFRYLDTKTGEVVVNDVKGVRTPLYKWKKKHTEAEYGITITEII